MCRRFRQGTSIPKSGDSLKLTLPLPPSSVESAQDGHSPPPSPRSTRSSAPDATLTCAEALTSLSEELAQLYDCGRNLSPLITDGWAHSLLSLMTLAMDEGMECEDYKTSLHELANSLLLEILADPTVRSMAIQQMATTSLRKSGTTFAHGLAHCGTDAVLRECQTESSEERTDVGGTADPRTTEETDVMPELEVRKLRGDEYVREHIQRSRCTDNQGWSLLHYATMGENLTMCGHLLTWGHDMYARDLQGSTPMAYCRNPAFAECIKKLQLVTDAFVSVGHTAQTDRVIAMLVEKAKDEQLKLWWDKGGQDDGPGIRPGEPWTAEIEKAMKKCKICIVILTKKWISSKFVCPLFLTFEYEFTLHPSGIVKAKHSVRCRTTSKLSLFCHPFLPRSVRLSQTFRAVCRLSRLHYLSVKSSICQRRPMRRSLRRCQNSFGL